MKKITEEVFYTEDDISKINAEDISFLKERARENIRGRARLCLHKNLEDPIHEMLIVLAKGIYIRPHKHVSKNESFHVIEGSLKVIIFDDTGKVVEVINMMEYVSGRVFLYRVFSNYFHTVIPVSEVVVFHETTNGPFNCEDTIFASWSPSEGDHDAVESYMCRLYDGY